MTHGDGTRRRRPARWAALVAAAALAAGCASANKSTSGTLSSTSSAGAGAMTGMAGMGTNGSGSGGSASGGSKAVAVDGIKPVPTQVLARASWQGMKISAMAMTAVPFIVYDGTSEQMVKPTSRTSFHLMVMLNDALTNVPIPYASVWATITRGGKVLYDERMWPMISRYMGPHYGNDVSLPGAGTYQLSLLVSPPVSARHVEYQDVWLKPHRVTMPFSWKPVT
jgi:uncharacterized protein involved in high-affinity Fe2+ transport